MLKVSELFHPIFCSNGNFHFFLHWHRSGDSRKEDDIHTRVQLGKQTNKTSKELQINNKTCPQVWKAPVLAFYVLMFSFGIFAGVGEYSWTKTLYLKELNFPKRPAYWQLLKVWPELGLGQVYSKMTLFPHVLTFFSGKHARSCH